MTFGDLSIEMTMLVLAIGLGIVQLVLAAQLANTQRGLKWAASARDEAQPPLTGVPGRASRAFANFLETFVFFAAAVLAVEATGRHDGLTVLGAELYLFGRIVYVPLYLAGVPVIRSIAWNVAAIGIAMVVAGLIWSPA